MGIVKTIENFKEKDMIILANRKMSLNHWYN